MVGVPPASQHDLGALAFATAIRRRGMDVLYLGADVPVSSWEAAVRTREARAAVLSIVLPADRAAAIAVAERLLSQVPAPLVFAGGAAAANLTGGVHSLPPSIAVAAEKLDLLAHETGDQRLSKSRHVEHGPTGDALTSGSPPTSARSAGE